MVTEIIKQNDVHVYYQNIHTWIRNGITDYAVDLYRHQWNNTPTHNYSNSYTVRNKDRFDKDNININPVNKW